MHTAAHGGYFDNIVLTLTDANDVTHAYPLPLSTEVVTLPSAGSLFGALPSGAQGPAVASAFATFSGTRRVHARTRPHCVCSTQRE
jgi:hypothetical protein